ncbi:MAG: TetR/AcrR family transcriptional regulator [Acetobacteraceae bacterium]|nr:TetR/AcrR family transcriptional regulator [Acetobacteraceae bacterium]
MSATADPRHDTESPKQQAILTAAGELFMHQGYGATSMDAIARGAGVSKATLYAHFASKDVLFATIINQACLDNIVVGEFLPLDAPDLAAALTALGSRMLRFLLEDRALAIHRVVTAESMRFPELGRAFYDNGPRLFREVFGTWLARQQAAGRLAVPDPGIAADQFIGMLRTGVYQRATFGLQPPPTEAEIDATVAAAVSTFLKAYAAD